MVVEPAPTRVSWSESLFQIFEGTTSETQLTTCGPSERFMTTSFEFMGRRALRNSSCSRVLRAFLCTVILQSPKTVVHIPDSNQAPTVGLGCGSFMYLIYDQISGCVVSGILL